MAWTVPSGCYYGALGNNEGVSFTYYTAGQVVPDARSPYNLNYGTILGIRFILVDFVNGYIYTNVSSSATYQIEININTTNRTFTATRLWSGGVVIGNNAVVDIIGSDECVSRLKFSLTGDQFNFGNGTGLMGKSELLGGSSIPYAMRHTFRGRTDITSGVIATGAEWLYYTFSNCNNLQSVSPQTISTIQCAYAVFYMCTSLTTAPTFLSVAPNGTVDYDNPDWGTGFYAEYASCFYGCSSLTTAPTIPNGIIGLNSCFYHCSSLTTAPTIPSSVTNMSSCFRGCVALVGAVTINSNTSSAANIFSGTVNEIVLLGTGGSNTLIASQYANVYVWSLSSSIAAQRDESVLTSVDISVDVTRFNTGTLTSLSLYENGGQTPLSVTWNDPTLTITGNPTTFTTTITGIAESDTPTISVIATDQYGSSTAMYVSIPIAFYTMDVQAGGKEIAFGAIADDDLTNYPPTFDTSDKGLFKCNMTMVNTQMVGEIKMWAGNNAPIGWLECDGSELAIADYPLLNNALGGDSSNGIGATLWGTPSDADHFVLPNLMGKVPVGQDINDTSFDVVGETGGSKYVQAHTHSFTNPQTTGTGSASITGGSHTHQYGYLTYQRGGGNYNTRVGPYGYNSSGVTQIGSSETTHTHSLPNHTHTISGGSVGAVSGATTGSAGNLQPYAVVKYIICAI